MTMDVRVARGGQRKPKRAADRIVGPWCISSLLASSPSTPAAFTPSEGQQPQTARDQQHKRA
ncbi:MAG: hypothetical protein ACYSWU_18775, partial [Planctomycetota bacterium]